MTLGGAAKGTMIAAVPTSITGGVMGNELIYVKEENAKTLKNKNEKYNQDLKEKEEEYNKNLENKDKELKEKTEFTYKKESDGSTTQMTIAFYSEKILETLFKDSCDAAKDDSLHLIQKVGKCAQQLKEKFIQRNQFATNLATNSQRIMDEIKKCNDEAQTKSNVDQMKNHLKSCWTKGAKITIEVNGQTTVITQ